MHARYNKSVAQLMIRWSVQKGFITIPKSSKQQRVLENAAVFDWTISEEDIHILVSSPVLCTSLLLIIATELSS